LLQDCFQDYLGKAQQLLCGPSSVVFSSLTHFHDNYVMYLANQVIKQQQTKEN
jgi:hypothetical protein